MKRIIILILSVFLSFGVFAQGGRYFVIKGTLQNVEDGTVFLLSKQEGRLGISVCSDTVRNGKFALKWTVVDGTDKYTLSPDTKESGFPPMGLDIWVKTGSVIEVTGNNKWFYTWDVKSDIPEQIERNRFVEANEANWNKLQTLLVESTTLSMKNTKTSEKKILTDSLNRLTQITLKKIVLNDIESFKHKSIITSAGVEVLERAVLVMKEENETTILSELKHYYSQLTKYQKETIVANNIYSILYPTKTVKVGDIMADGELFDLNGNKHYLSEYKGEYLLLDFWADGCGACIQALPKLAKIYDKQRDKLKIIGINMNSPSVWKKRNNINKITWINLNDKKEYSGLATKYGLRTMPLYVFISPEGKILFSTSYWEELEKEMKEYIK